MERMRGAVQNRQLTGGLRQTFIVVDPDKLINVKHGRNY